jgi:hypothetical protein
MHDHNPGCLNYILCSLFLCSLQEVQDAAYSANRPSHFYFHIRLYNRKQGYCAYVQLY